MSPIRDCLSAHHPVRRTLRTTRDLARYFHLRLRGNRPDIVLTFGTGGIGDSLLCSAVCRELQKRAHRTVWILTPYPALFENNGDIAATLPFNDDLSRFLQRQGHHVLRPHYNVNHWEDGRDEPPREHLITALCRAAGITKGVVALRPYLHLTAREKRAGKIASHQIAIQSSGRAARFFMATKEWFPERFASVAVALARTHTVVQVGGVEDPLLPDVVDLRGKTTVRETAAILSQSEAFVGLVGLLMHLARAVDCPSVIVYGGRESPSQSGYSANKNITRTPECAPCWLWHHCDHAMICMRTIMANDVIAAVLELLGSTREELPTVHVNLESQT